VAEKLQPSDDGLCSYRGGTGVGSNRKQEHWRSYWPAPLKEGERGRPARALGWGALNAARAATGSIRSATARVHDAVARGRSKNVQELLKTEHRTPASQRDAFGRLPLAKTQS
jgi:hypothetical protein